MTTLKIYYSITGKFFSVFTLIFLIQGCTKSTNLKKLNMYNVADENIMKNYTSSFSNDKHILYFTSMGEEFNQGKMFFRHRLKLSDIKELQKKKKSDSFLEYYKVFHNCMPYKVEAYDFKTNRLKYIYWFNKDAVNTKLRKYNNQGYIDCNNTYIKDNKITIKIKSCSDNSKEEIAYSDIWRWQYTYYYKNNKKYKKEIRQGNNIAIYQNGILTSVRLYGEPDIYPMHIPELDDYPWCSL